MGEPESSTMVDITPRPHIYDYSKCNVLNTPIKCQRLSHWIKKKLYAIYKKPTLK